MSVHARGGSDDRCTMRMEECEQRAWNGAIQQRREMVGLEAPGHELGEQLVASDADRYRQAQLELDGLSDLLRVPSHASSS